MAAAALFLPLYLWRITYPLSDWAVLSLLPLSLILFFGNLSFSTTVFQARLRAAIKPASPLKSILSGRIIASLGTVSFVVISILLLAWQALVSNELEILILIALSIFSGALFISLRSRLLHHFHYPFGDAVAILFSTVIAGVVFTFIMAWMNLNYFTYPGQILTASLPEAMMHGLQELPRRRGWIAEILAPLYAYEAGKIWAVVQLGSTKWVTILFSLETALVSFVFARASIILTVIVKTFDQGEEAL